MFDRKRVGASRGLSPSSHFCLMVRDLSLQGKWRCDQLQNGNCQTLLDFEKAWAL